MSPIESGVVPTSEETGSLSLQIVQCLTEGLPLNIAVRSHGSTFKTLIGGEECSIHPSSQLFGKNLVTEEGRTHTAAAAL